MNDKIVKITHYIREKFFATVLRHALSMMLIMKRMLEIINMLE